MKATIYLAGILILWTTAVFATTYDQLYVRRVVDGDTFHASVTIWPRHEVTTSIRINGLDTPEMRGKCPIEKEKAREAQKALAEILSVGGVELRNVVIGKYAGRVVADVYVSGTNVTEAMIAKGMGRAYTGGKREPWC